MCPGRGAAPARRRATGTGSGLAHRGAQATFGVRSCVGGGERRGSFRPPRLVLPEPRAGQPGLTQFGAVLFPPAMGAIGRRRRLWRRTLSARAPLDSCPLPNRYCRRRALGFPKPGWAGAAQACCFEMGACPGVRVRAQRPAEPSPMPWASAMFTRYGLGGSTAARSPKWHGGHRCARSLV